MLLTEAEVKQFRETEAKILEAALDWASLIEEGRWGSPLNCRDEYHLKSIDDDCITLERDDFGDTLTLEVPTRLLWDEEERDRLAAAIAAKIEKRNADRHNNELLKQKRLEERELLELARLRAKYQG